MLQQHDIDKIHIEDILTEYGLSYTITSTKNANFNCPFHGEKNPSCGINIETGLYKCFACGEAGNLIQFVSKMEDISLEDAEHKIRKQYLEGFVDPNSLVARVQNILQGPVQKPIEEDAYYSPWILTKYTKDYTYMINRNISQETCEHFNVLYDPETKFQVFPVYDEVGRLVGASGRNTQQGEPRYKFLLRFKKSEYIYNLNNIDLEKPVIAVEGQINCMAMHQAGYTNVIALLGAGVSRKQIEILKNSNIKELIIFFDSDEAGKHGMNFIYGNLWVYTKIKAVAEHEDDPATMSKEQIVQLVEHPEEFKHVLL